MKTNVEVYAKPQVVVRISNLVVDAKTREFSLTLGTKSLDKRVKKFEERLIKGKMKKDVIDFFYLKIPDKIKTVADNEKGYEWTPTGTSSTKFQRWCLRNETNLTSLVDFVFEDDNCANTTSKNPFKLVMNADGVNILSLVYTHSATKVQHVDPNTGEILEPTYTKKYVNYQGVWQPAFVAPQFYCRLIVATTKEVELVPVE